MKFRPQGLVLIGLLLFISTPSQAGFFSWERLLSCLASLRGRPSAPVPAPALNQRDPSELERIVDRIMSEVDRSGPGNGSVIAYTEALTGVDGAELDNLIRARFKATPETGSLAFEIPGFTVGGDFRLAQLVAQVRAAFPEFRVSLEGHASEGQFHKLVEALFEGGMISPDRPLQILALSFLPSSSGAADPVSTYLRSLVNARAYQASARSVRILMTTRFSDLRVGGGAPYPGARLNIAQVLSSLPFSPPSSPSAP